MIYFASDFHLGAPNREISNIREKLIIRWLDSIQPDAEALYLLGDVFDAWVEYRKVVPRGYIRFLGKLAEWRDAGIPIYAFTGNHDLWVTNYFEEELGIPVFKKYIVAEHHG
jgi:UDP-2,3-diacylglucosamine hydrolase